MLIYCPAIIINMNQQQNGKTEARILFPIVREASILTCDSFTQRIGPPSLQTLQFFQKFQHPNYKITSAFRIYSEKGAINVKESVPRKQRGNYRKYTVAEKQQAVKELVEGGEPKLISQRYGIPRRNLLRWKKDGCQRKDPETCLGLEIQHLLYKLIDNKIISTEVQIRAQAKRLSRMSDFQASKGWYTKFVRRYSSWKQQQERQLNTQAKQETGKQKDASSFLVLFSVNEDSNDYGSVATDKIE